MKIPFTPTWAKVESLREGFGQFRYIFDKDVEKEWKKGYDQLNVGRQMAVRFWWLTSELNNGGLDQYFWNSSGDFASDTIADLRRIGYESAAEILVSASQKLFGDPGPPRETLLRRAAIEDHYGTHPFNDDDDRERLAMLEDKVSLVRETRQLDSIQKDVAIALVTWMRVNRSEFTHIKDTG
ncbi:DMP19 family protein [Luteolibacter marinus]|uniref:DMP19 family protein n=1 Tax=Luteolibacter marinus TaxID=2776705 RepID=UPI0018662D75|nr:DUF4375 domain-containing protein [Luteolibacter marinus]